MGHQLSMTGDDWMSDRDKRRIAKDKAAQVRAALSLAARLRMAADAVVIFNEACRAVGEGAERADDSRVRLLHDLMEYAGFLTMVYDKNETGGA